ncbi:MAG: response regulator transcription factor [Planctomycetales bacterium]|nr:response regulator transcription factor [Planctomycetales bacterium]
MNLTEQALKILVIEDDMILGRALTQGLADQGYDCRLASDGTQALKMAEKDAFSVVILDLALEDESGLGVLRCMREANENANVIILTPLEFRQERIAGLEAGADDFVIKPFTLDEIRARVEAAIIRSKTKPKSMLEIGPLVMDLTSRKVVRSGRQVPLTPTEFRILEILMRNQGKAVTRRMLCEFLWQPDWEGVTNVIEVHINRLRSKLTGESESQMIFTIRGSGYTLRWEPSGEPSGPAMAGSTVDSRLPTVR